MADSYVRELRVCMDEVERQLGKVKLLINFNLGMVMVLMGMVVVLMLGG